MKTLKSIAIFLGLFIGSFGFASAATIILTNSSDTLNTFRTNVNTSLTNLNTAIGSAFSWTTLSTGENATSTTLVFGNGFLSNASSTLLKFNATSATTTNATSTTFATGTLCLTGDTCRTTWPTASMTFAFPFLKLSTNEMSTSTTLLFGNGFIASASSTLSKIGNLTSNGFVKTSGGDGTLSVDTNVYQTFPWPFTKLATNEQSTSTTIVLANGVISNSSSTLSSLTATTTQLNVSANHISFGSAYVGTTTTLSLNVASSTLVNGASYNRATTTFQFAPWLENRQIVGASCMATSTGGVLFRVGGKTNTTAVLFCDVNPRTYTFTAIQVSAFSDFLNVSIQAASSTADRASINIVTQKVSD